MKSLPAYSPLRRMGFICLAVLLMTTALGLLTQLSSQDVMAQPDELGGPLPNVTPLETTLFESGLLTFTNFWGQSYGLGPVYNQKSCSGCHSSPVVGGGSPGNTKKDLLFLTPNGGEGGPLLQIHGIGGTPPCDFEGEVLPADATLTSKRITPQTFGSGLINSIPDSDIPAQAVDKGMGVHGSPNMVVDENGNLRPGRFGYKSETATLVQDVAQSMVGQIGITNPISPNEELPQGIPIPPACGMWREPNDDGRGMIAILHFLLYLAPNTAGSPNPNGQALFNSIGCALCHLPSYTTGDRIKVLVDWGSKRTILSKALSNQPVPLYSDLLLHDMGAKLQDGFVFEGANGRQFRTAPLWGISTRTAYLHNGIASTLDMAISAHASPGSEANQVITNYKALSPADQADLLAFVGSL